MFLRLLALSLLPGVRHIQYGRPGRGIAWFFFFALAVNTILIAPILPSSRSVRIAAIVAAAGLWLLACWDGVRCATAKPEPAPDVPAPEELSRQR